MVIIIRKLGGLFYRPMRQSSSIQTNYIGWQCGRCGSCECELVEEALQALDDYEHPQHDAQASF